MSATGLYRVRATIEYIAWADSPDEAEQQINEVMFDCVPSDLSYLTTPFNAGDPMPYGWDDDSNVYCDEHDDLTVAEALALQATTEQDS
jgi:hypothetical protein